MEKDTKVLDFLIAYTGIKSLKKNSNIASDQYKIFDLDAENLMENFFEKFEINYKGFIIDKYFNYPDYSWRELVFLKPFFKKKVYSERQELLISHLIEVAKRKEWFDPS
ncbi:hypothetical protein Pf1_02240 [Flavobacterium columnare]|uniref:DUF1493 family protein n=1 Tax=Flavobacterium columnare TaxID=996 RepID=UPI0007F9B669|nr:DUF1493 family protein [Flavobacterium columnare]ANO47695.1 hypothetical protein Pf1_02240 [Flavobacterium columnare]APT21688.1 hypothetical protein BU993_02975 [Flavobacterium columnare]